MAVIAQTFIDLLDVHRGQVAGDIIEIMNNTSQNIMEDWVYQEANGTTEHQRSVRTGLPKPAWMALYEGIPQSKSATQMVKDTMGFVQSRSSMDTRLVDVYGPKAREVMALEAAPQIEGMAQELISAMFYHNPATNVRLPKGLGARFSTLGQSGAAKQVIDGGGTGSDNTSVWFTTWGYNDLSVIYPVGTSGGIKQEDMGKQRVQDENGNPYWVFEEIFTAYAGFSLGDWRNQSRVANVDVSDVQAGTVDLYDLMSRAYWRLRGARLGAYVKGQQNPGRTVIYMNPVLIEALDKQTRTGGIGASRFLLTPSQLEGREVWTFRGIPIRPTDALLLTESRVV